MGYRGTQRDAGGYRGIKDDTGGNHENHIVNLKDNAALFKDDF